MKKLNKLMFITYLKRSIQVYKMKQIVVLKIEKITSMIYS